MSEQNPIPFELRSADPKLAGELLNYSPRYVAETLAKRPDFPKRVDKGGRPRWRVKDLLEWRDGR